MLAVLGRDPFTGKGACHPDRTHPVAVLLPVVDELEPTSASIGLTARLRYS